ncbi:MAG: response regulator [bacterium]|nr:response regulator [bacterium]MDT8366869.1 response regulator [bacterium]
MKLACVLCQKEYVFDPDKIPDGGFRIGCGVCGAKYTVVLPDGWKTFGAQPAPAISGSSEASQEAGQDLNQVAVPDEKYILMADDTAFFRALMSDLLTKQGFKVKTAGDGREALNIFLASPKSFMLLLLDLQMPKLSGFGVLEELKGLEGYVPPIIVMTGVHDSHEDIKIVRDMGASGFLDKSLDPSVAVERIKMVMAEHEGK